MKKHLSIFVLILFMFNNVDYSNGSSINIINFKDKLDKNLKKTKLISEFSKKFTEIAVNKSFPSFQAEVRASKLPNKREVLND